MLAIRFAAGDLAYPDSLGGYSTLHPFGTCDAMSESMQQHHRHMRGLWLLTLPIVTRSVFCPCNQELRFDSRGRR